MIAPAAGSTSTCAITETVTANGNTALARMSRPSGCTKPRASAAVSAIPLRYGPRKTVRTVVENAELAQS
jgi:hypothetical protein